MVIVNKSRNRLVLDTFSPVYGEGIAGVIEEVKGGK